MSIPATATLERLSTRAPYNSYDDVPKVILDAFERRAALPSIELAGLMEVTEKTLRGFCTDGLMPWHEKGRGELRTHRVFTLSDVAEYYRRTRREGVPSCPSTSTATPRSGISTSSSTIIVLADRQRSRSNGPGERPKRSKRKSVGRPSDLSKRSGGLAENH
jgi:hypothetical protein